MPEKQEVLDSLNKHNYSLKEVKTLVHSVRTTMTIQAPSTLKAGDVFLTDWGLKRRPLMIIAVREKLGLVVAVSMTTTENELSMTPFKSRFFGEAWFCNQLVTAKIEDAKDNFIGVMESRQAIRDVKKDLKQFYNGIL